MSFVKEFKDFAIKGNVIDMAIGIIVGVAFGKIISSLVADIIMPPIGLLLGDTGLSSYRIILSPEIIDQTGTIISEAVAINWGLFTQNIVDFIIIALVIFTTIKMINTIKKKEDKQHKETKPTVDQALLMEIRDLLKNHK